MIRTFFIRQLKLMQKLKWKMIFETEHEKYELYAFLFWKWK